MKGRGKLEIPEKTSRAMVSSGTIPTCEYTVKTLLGIKPGSPRLGLRDFVFSPKVTGKPARHPCTLLLVAEWVGGKSSHRMSGTISSAADAQPCFLPLQACQESMKHYSLIQLTHTLGCSTLWPLNYLAGDNYLHMESHISLNSAQLLNYNGRERYFEREPEPLLKLSPPCLLGRCNHHGSGQLYKMGAVFCEKENVEGTNLSEVDSTWLPCLSPNLRTFRMSDVVTCLVDLVFKTITLARGAMVAERLARSPPTKANWVQSPAASPDFCKWKLCRTMPLVCGFLGDLPFPPPLHSGAAPYSHQSPSSALKTSLLRATQISSLTHSEQHSILYEDGRVPQSARGHIAEHKGSSPTLLAPNQTYESDIIPPTPAQAWAGRAHNIRQCAAKDANCIFQ
ncbi:hypothetical protein PR048_017328 [Dryococelus australis]|uniref:Uncharacterized protein n=1 Tax=Dryococelus australis TaxID=614101 RepID=A0ABQ9H9D2_9NEOP|nr:hypothetical protein PR048_017328 [Dryococelus australis]